MANWLVKLGYQVCCLDLLAKKPTDVVDEAAWNPVEKDVVDGLRTQSAVAMPGPVAVWTRLRPSYLKEPGEFEGRTWRKPGPPSSPSSAPPPGRGEGPGEHANPGISLGSLGHRGRRPGLEHLARWLDHGAPLGITEPIETNGVFPPTEARDRLPPTRWTGERSRAGGTTAQPTKRPLRWRSEDYVTRHFCTRARSYKEATQLLQEEPVPYLAGVDIRDAFMNIPAGKDRRFTVAAVSRRNKRNSYYLVIFNTSVFGSASSPTLRGRMGAPPQPSASRTCSCTWTTRYMPWRGPTSRLRLDLTVVLLWTAIAGFPVKLSKASGGWKDTGVGGSPVDLR